MAWRQRFGNSFRKMEGGYRGRNFGRGRYYAVGKRGFQAGYGGINLRLGIEYIAGFLLGLSDYDEKIPAELKIAAASAPISGKGIGKVKGFAQGMLLGNVIQHRTGFTLGGSGGTKSGSGNPFA